MGKSFFMPCFGKRSKKPSVSLTTTKNNTNIDNKVYPSINNHHQYHQNEKEKDSHHANAKTVAVTNELQKKGSISSTTKRSSSKKKNQNEKSNDYVTIGNNNNNNNNSSHKKQSIEKSNFIADWVKPEVTQILLSHLPISSLITCRAVCKAWCTEASRLLRLNEHFCNTISTANLRAFTQTMSASFDNPMQSYQFHINSMRHPDLRYFFGQLGPTIVSLDLNLLITETEAFFNILPWMPNLLELMLILFHGDNRCSSSLSSSNSNLTTSERKDGEKPELLVKLVDTEIINYIENTKTLIYCNYELKICQKELESKSFSLTNKNKYLITAVEEGVEEEEEENDEKL